MLYLSRTKPLLRLLCKEIDAARLDDVASSDF